MIKKLFFIGFIIISSVGLVACHHTPIPSVSPRVVRASSNPYLCEYSLKSAHYNLAFAKQQAKNAHVFTDWTLASQALSDAQNAYQAKNYPLCVEKARLVNSYIERNESYIKWRNSLNL